MADDILMLNDYCLLEIFKKISLLDLANVRETYAALNALTDREFLRRTHGSLFICSNETTDSALQIIKQFGPFINSLKFINNIMRETKWRDIFELLNEHCVGTLKTLTLRGRAIDFIKTVDVLLFADILKNLETIVIDNDPYEGRQLCDAKEFVNILSYCKNVRSITLFNDIDIDLHQTIFQENRSLQKLNYFGRLFGNDLKTIVDNLMTTRIEELNIAPILLMCDEDLSQLSRLRYLKRLRVDFGSDNIQKFLINLGAYNALNVLSLKCELHENNVETLSQSTQLKVLKLVNSYHTDLCFEFVVRLSGNRNFEHLILFSYLEAIDKNKFLRIVETRKASKPENCLHLSLRRDVYIESLKAIPSELLEANKETIQLIHEMDREYEYFDLE